jgi:2-polyprenyl-3-methyl-5-hydroxy-6-metoxy-1,4-benzoquinol methylase
MHDAQTEDTATNLTSSGSNPLHLFEAIRTYWNQHIHDLEIARHPIGTKGFFDELTAYRFEKLAYLPRVVNFPAYQGKRLLEVGCGIGIDLVRFAKLGAIVTGIDLAEASIELARTHFALYGLRGDLQVMNGEDLQFSDGSFDVVYAHGVLQYTSNTQRMIHEIHRVLQPDGEAILMVYNRFSWLNAMSKLFGVKLEHEDAPVLRMYSTHEFRRMLGCFSQVTIVPERFPVRTRLHHGIKAVVYNTAFVSACNRLPQTIIRPFGWHLIASAIKGK